MGASGSMAGKLVGLAARRPTPDRDSLGSGQSRGTKMRGADEHSGTPFNYVDIEAMTS